MAVTFVLTTATAVVLAVTTVAALVAAGAGTKTACFEAFATGCAICC